jgi:hypothetical protein
VHLCILYGSQNKQRLFPYTALLNSFYNPDGVCLLRGTNLSIYIYIYIYIIQVNYTSFKLKLLVAGFSPRRPGFDGRLVNVRFLVDEVVMGIGFFRVLRVSPGDMVPPMVHTLIFIDTYLTRITSGRSLGTFPKATLSRKSGNNTVEPGYNDIGLYDTSPIASDFLW